MGQQLQREISWHPASPLMICVILLVMSNSGGGSVGVGIGIGIGPTSTSTEMSLGGEARARRIGGDSSGCWTIATGSADAELSFMTRFTASCWKQGKAWSRWARMNSGSEVRNLRPDKNADYSERLSSKTALGLWHHHEHKHTDYNVQLSLDHEYPST